MNESVENTSTESRSALHDRSLWVRGLYTLFFWLAYAIAETLVAVLAVFQFVHVLLTGKTHDAVYRFAHQLNLYILGILDYVAFKTEALPFPFSDWPDGEPQSGEWTETDASAGMTYAEREDTLAPGDNHTDPEPPR